MTPNYEYRGTRDRLGNVREYVFDTRTGELYERRGTGLKKMITKHEIKYALSDWFSLNTFSLNTYDIPFPIASKAQIAHPVCILP